MAPTGTRSPIECIVILAIVVASTACERERERVESFPLDVRFLQFADTLGIAATDTIWVGAMVAFEGCTLEHAGIERHGNTLRIGGYARCLVRDYGKSAGIATPPVQPKYEIHPYLLPALDPGTYVLDGGAVVDTIVVASWRASPSMRIAAFAFPVAAWPSCAQTNDYVVVDMGPLTRVYETAVGTWEPGSPQVVRGVLEEGVTCTQADIAGRIREYHRP